MGYYIREGQAANWTKTTATTLADAKRAAVRAQTFQGTDAWVGQEIDGRVYPVAVRRHRDALNMSARGAWVEMDPDFASCGDIETA